MILFDTPSNKVPKPSLQTSIKRKQLETSEVDDPNSSTNTNNSNKLKRFKKDFETIEYKNAIINSIKKAFEEFPPSVTPYE